MLKRHEIQVLLKAGHSRAEVARLAGISLRSVKRIAQEADVTHVDDAGARRTPAIGRPSVVQRFRKFVAAVLQEEPALRSVEVLRRARGQGYTGGKTAFYAVVAEARPKEVRPLVRFEGLPGEFSQHDFGQVDVTYLGGVIRRIRFFASRLKYSRTVRVSLVLDETVETLVRTLADHLHSWGGAPLMCVFDRPKTVALKWRRDGVVTEWNPTFAYVALELGIGVEVCWPYRAQEKGLVENLVGFVKGSFFKQRRFLDEADLRQQLADWQREVNDERPCRATRVIPAVRLAEEAPRLRPLKVAPADLALRIPVYVGPTGTVIHDTHPYSMPPEAIGIAGTLYLYRDGVRIVAGRARPAVHPGGRRYPAGASGGPRRGRLRQAWQALPQAVAAARPRRTGPGLSDRGGASAAAPVDPRRRSPARVAAGARTRAVAAGLEPEHRAPDLRGAFHPARPEGPAATRGRDPVTTTPPFQLSEIELDALLKRLHLPNMRRLYRHVAVQAEEAQWAYRDFLGFLVAEEVAHRTQTRLQRLTRKAGFPFLKTIDDFDFTLQSTLRAALLGSFLTPDFVTDGRSLILQGKTGRGKTHLAVAIAYRAIQNGFEAGFTTAAHLIEDLANASQRGQLHEALPAYTQPHVLVVDEVGYLSYGPDAANVLYHVVNDRHLRKRPMIFTTNKPLTQWGRVLHDPDLAAAILDRVLERGRLLPLDGPSGRTRHLKLDQVFPEDAKDARISGSPGPEYPEPATGHRPRHGEACSGELAVFLPPRRAIAFPD